MAVTFTQAEVDAYRAFMLNNQGIQRMSFGGRHYEFAPLKEMREQLAYMQRNLDTASEAGRVRYAATSKGVR